MGAEGDELRKNPRECRSAERIETEERDGHADAMHERERNSSNRNHGGNPQATIHGSEEEARSNGTE